jgi:hypothetical protein
MTGMVAHPAVSAAVGAAFAVSARPGYPQSGRSNGA